MKWFIIILAFNAIIGSSGPVDTQQECEVGSKRIYEQIIIFSKLNSIESITVNNKTATLADIKVECQQYDKSPPEVPYSINRAK